MKKYIYAGIILGTVMLAGCDENEVTKKQGELENGVLADKQIVEVNDAIPLNLTSEQKEEYHKEYVKIVKEVHKKKLGIGIEVSSIERFQLEDWKEPKAYEEMIQDVVEAHMANEREALKNVSSTKNQIVTNANGSTTKKTHTYVLNSILPIEVPGNFETQYNADNDGQIFAEVSNITTDIEISDGKWEQTSYETSLTDDSNYSIRIEGIFSNLGLSVEKAFTVEFNCDEFGNVS